MTTRIHILPVLVAALALTLSNCNKSETIPTSAAPAAITPAPDERLIELTADDLMKYNVTEISAKPGEKLVLTLKNIGRLPKQAMAHNWVLLKPMDDTALNAFCMAAVTRPPEFLPADTSPILAHTNMVGPGESASVRLTAPATPGEYRYVCTFPGHSVLMRGKFLVN